jgi:hypothetical protein
VSAVTPRDSLSAKIRQAKPPFYPLSYGDVRLGSRFLNAAGMLAALVLLATFWLIGAIAMVPWYFRGVEGQGMALEALEALVD